MHDRAGKGFLNVDDLMVALSSFSLRSLRSLGSDEHTSLNLTGEIGAAVFGETNEQRICALLAHIVTSESIFLTKV